MSFGAVPSSEARNAGFGGMNFVSPEIATSQNSLSLNPKPTNPKR